MSTYPAQIAMKGLWKLALVWGVLIPGAVLLAAALAGGVLLMLGQGASDAALAARLDRLWWVMTILIWGSAIAAFVYWDRVCRWLARWLGREWVAVLRDNKVRASLWFVILEVLFGFGLAGELGRLFG